MTLEQCSRGGDFIYEDTERRRRYSLCRGTRVVELCQQELDSVGFVGSDVAYETDVDGEVVAQISNLRFSLLANQRALSLSRLQGLSDVRCVSSYPRMAAALCRRLSLDSVAITAVSGCIEGELVRGDFDVAIELVQSGGSVEDNGLTIVEDNLEKVTVVKLGGELK